MRSDGLLLPSPVELNQFCKTSGESCNGGAGICDSSSNCVAPPIPVPVPVENTIECPEGAQLINNTCVVVGDFNISTSVTIVMVT